MKQFFKQKFYIKLLNFLKYKKNKKIKTYINKIDLNTEIKYKKYFKSLKISEKGYYYLKKLNKYELNNNKIYNLQNDNNLLIKKKKYKLNSYLFNILCKYPRYKNNILFNKNIIIQNNTIPYRLSLSRFIGNKIIYSYYNNLTNLLNLHKKIFIKIKKIKNNKKDNKQIYKNYIINLEKRLYSTLYRLLQFKSLYIKKYKNNIENIQYKIKLPFKNYTKYQIKQLINHGHIYINGKIIKNNNYSLKLTDKILLKGFINNNLWNTHNYKNNIKNIPFLKNKNQLLSDLIYISKNKIINNNLIDILYNNNIIKNNNINEIKLLCEYINNFKIKRYSEIYYLTYKNFYLIPNSSIYLTNTLTCLKRFNNLKFYYQIIGYNQSIYLLWPLISLITIKSWNIKLKNDILNDIHLNRMDLKKKIQNTFLIQKNLKNLINLKDIQNKIIKLNKNNIKLPFINNDKNKLLDKIISINKSNIYLIYPLFNNNNIARNRNIINYANIIYGTRKCKWVKLQQQKGFYNKIYHKFNFYELELDFIQLTYRHYKN